jgi:cytochrome c-type protein NapC
MMFEENENDIQPQGKMAAKKHQKAKAEGKTCIDCHKGIAHTEPDEPEEETKD